MEALRQLTTESERSCLFGHSEFNLGSVGSSDFVRLNPGPYLSTSRWRDTVGKGEGEQRRQQEEDLQTMTLPQGQSGWMYLGKTKAVISWTYERWSEGFKITQQRGCDALLSGVSLRTGQAFAASFLSFTHPSPLELPLPSHCTHIHTCTSAHSLHISFSLEKRKLLQTNSSSPHSFSPFPPVSHTRRSLLCPPFVYFTPSIMQGLISQSRFELRHASAKSGEQNFCAGGSFPFTLA